MKMLIKYKFRVRLCEPNKRFTYFAVERTLFQLSI